MRELRFNILVIGLLLGQVLSGQGMTDTKSDTIPFDFTSYNNIVIDALINEKDSLRLMFHTAANDVSLIEKSTTNQSIYTR